MTRKNFPIVFVGSKKFFVSQRGLIDGEPLPIDRVPEQSEILTAMRALSHSQRSSHPLASIGDLTFGIRKRYGYLSPGAMILALHRLRIDLKALSRSEVFAAIQPEWIQDQRQIDRRFIRPMKRYPVGRVETDQYSRPSNPVPIVPELGRGALEHFWADGWEVTS